MTKRTKEPEVVSTDCVSAALAKADAIREARHNFKPLSPAEEDQLHLMVLAAEVRRLSSVDNPEQSVRELVRAANEAAYWIGKGNKGPIYRKLMKSLAPFKDLPDERVEE